MEQILVKGGIALSGSVEVSGFKNAALPILFATVLTGDICTIENVPDISDVTTAVEILCSMGARIRRVGLCTLEIDTRQVVCGASPYELVRAMRGSVYVLGAELGRFHQARVGWPGGCDFGIRPIDQHIKAFEALGATVQNEGGYITGHAERLVGSNIYFDVVSVGATVNAILAAVLAEGLTVIDNAAREPHIVDLANFLNTCGAMIKGAGTDVIKVYGVERLHGCSYAIIPDMIEAGTFMVAAAATGGEVRITNVIPKHLEAISAKLDEMGVEILEEDEAVTVRSTGILRAINVKTLPYPGFPTDMHPQIGLLLCLANGTSHITENIWENRFRYVEEFVRMGASIKVNGKTATIEGGHHLFAAPVRAVDLRAGAAMILAGLVADGTTVIHNIESIERGYDNIVGKLRSLGAEIYQK